jgi:penicillin amidase
MGGCHALRWVGHQPTDELTAMLGMNRARSFDEFQSAAAGFAVPGQTFIVAEASGGIAKQITVKIPRRPDGARSYPLSPRDAIEAWEHLATTLDFPPQRDPACGFLVSANDPPAEVPVPLSFLFSPADRRERIAGALAASQPISREAMFGLQRDVAQPGAGLLRDRLVALIEAMAGNGRNKTAPRRILTLLREWDAVYCANSRGALAFELLMAHLCQHYYSKAERAFQGTIWTGRMLAAAGLTPGARLLRALERALKKTNRDLARYAAWGDLHRLVLAHPLSIVPIVGRRLIFADLPAAGSSDTVMKTAGPSVPRRHRAVYGSVARLVADLSGMDETYAVLLGGQDGWLGSDTMLDQLGLWREGGTVQLPLDPATAIRMFPHSIVLQPGAPR